MFRHSNKPNRAQPPKRRRGSSRLNRVSLFRCGAFLLGPLFVALFLLQAIACDTPVYRYAIYQWTPNPYVLYHLREEAPQDSFDAVETRFKDINGPDNPIETNLHVIDVDLSNRSHRHLLPECVEAAWEARPEDAPPFASYFVSPKDKMVAEGDFSDPAYIEGLLDSPARQTAKDLLALGSPGVFLFLPGTDDTENEAAETRAKDALAQIREGKGKTTDGVQTEPSLPAENMLAIDFGFLHIDRTDPQEAWLVRMLLAVEDGLNDHEGPMLFPLFGRGRALAPLVAEDITLDEIRLLTNYLTEACKCTVAEENPGVDLLIQADWESISKGVAKIYGREEGNEDQFSTVQLFPEIISPFSAETEAPDPDPYSEEETPLVNQQPHEEASEETEEVAPSVLAESTAAEQPEVLATEPAPFSNRLLGTIGVGVAIVIALLLAATFFLFRPKASKP